MDYQICINKNSFPADSDENAINLLEDALQGVLRLQEKADRFFFYLDSNNQILLDFEIAKHFTFENFLQRITDPDMKLFLSEIVDKSPALDNLTLEQVDEIACYSYYAKDRPLDVYPDVYGLALVISGYLLSINTESYWQKIEIEIARNDEIGRPILEKLKLRHISTFLHGEYYYNQQKNIDINELVKPHFISNELLTWIEQQIPENKNRIIDKLRQSVIREFEGAEPLFKNLIDFDGMREIRFSAYTGGAIRILFKHVEAKKYALLLGFIKFRDNEGYNAAKIKAASIYHEMVDGISMKDKNK